MSVLLRCREDHLVSCDSVFLPGPGLIIELLKERELRVSLMRENGKRDQAGPDYFKLTEGVVTEGVVTEGVVY